MFFPVENGGSSWNVWELAIGERGQLEVKDEKEKHALGWSGRDCRRSIWSSLPAVLKTLEHEFGNKKALWSQRTHR